MVVITAMVAIRALIAILAIIVIITLGQANEIGKGREEKGSITRIIRSDFTLNDEGRTQTRRRKKLKRRREDVGKMLERCRKDVGKVLEKVSKNNTKSFNGQCNYNVSPGLYHLSIRDHDVCFAAGSYFQGFVFSR